VVSLQANVDDIRDFFKAYQLAPSGVYITNGADSRVTGERMMIS
jgi:hypothetical protein